MRIQNGKNNGERDQKAITRTYVQFMQARQIAGERALLAQLTDAQLRTSACPDTKQRKSRSVLWDIPATKR